MLGQANEILAAFTFKDQTVEAVKKGQYPYARVLRLYTDKGAETPITRDFIQFVQSPDQFFAVLDSGRK